MWTQMTRHGHAIQGGEEGGYTLHAHVPGDARKKMDIVVYLSVYHPYNCTYVGSLGQVTMETEMQPAAIENPAHALAMCTGPSLLLSPEGLGTRLIRSQYWPQRVG